MLFGVLNATSQGTAFTYQGQLGSSGTPSNGNYDFRFTVYDSANPPGNIIAGPITNAAVPVNNGMFTATLDFGVGVFGGSNYWLEVAVQTNNGNGFTILSPRQPITPAPNAIFAANSRAAVTAASANSVSPEATIPLAALPPVLVTNGQGGGTFSGNGSGLTNLNPSQFSGFQAGNPSLSNLAAAITVDRSGDITGPGQNYYFQSNGFAWVNYLRILGSDGGNQNSSVLQIYGNQAPNQFETIDVFPADWTHSFSNDQVIIRFFRKVGVWMGCFCRTPGP